MSQTTTTDPKLIRCPVCEAVNIDNRGEMYCHRCNSRIYHHPKNGLKVTWSLLITAIILYFPANFYPILHMNIFMSDSQNTIIGGILLLWEDGSYPVALIILLASVFIPILKFILLIYLLISVKYPVLTSKKVRHKLYYFTEIIGSWSMVDVFVVTILTGLVKFDSFRIVAGPGATAFVLMVFFTMLAAFSFDLRLMKDGRKDRCKGDDYVAS